MIKLYKQINLTLTSDQFMVLRHAHETATEQWKIDTKASKKHC